MGTLNIDGQGLFRISLRDVFKVFYQTTIAETPRDPLRETSPEERNDKLNAATKSCLASSHCSTNSQTDKATKEKESNARHRLQDLVDKIKAVTNTKKNANE